MGSLEFETILDCPIRPDPAVTTRPLVCFQSIRKTYDGEHLVIDDLDLDIAHGEFLTLLGPSGSGKTTTLMMLAGFEMPTSGQILLDERPIQNIPAHRRDIGMVFQNYALFPHMNVAENISYPLKVRRRPSAEIGDRVDKVLDMVQMRGFAERKPALLSGGQQQRIALARALVFEPKLILMDEPLGALDKRLREDMQLEIKRIHDRLGITIVYVTHDQSEALTMSDRIAIFNGGRIEQIDSPAVLYETPRTSFVAGFIGDNNVLGGVVVDTNADFCHVRITGGSLIAVRNGAALKQNENAVVSVRPEKLRLTVNNDDLENGIRAKIRDRIYLGDHMQVHLETDDGHKLVVKRLNFADDLPIEIGHTYTVAWSSKHSIALKA